MASNRQSATDTAKELVCKLLAEMKEHSNLGAIVLWLARSPRTVQHRVLDALRPLRRSGRPKNPINDDDWLVGIESWREWMRERDGNGRRPSDRTVVADWLLDTNTRYLTRHDRPRASFRPNSPAGKKEINRIIDAAMRARRRLKNPPKKA